MNALFSVSILVAMTISSPNSQATEVLIIVDTNVLSREQFLAELGQRTAAGESSFSLRRTFHTFEGFEGTMSAELLNELRSDNRILIEPSEISHVTLDHSIPQIHADDAWPHSINGVNVKGQGQAVCVVDTGIDTDHVAFGDRILGEHCFCRLSNDDGLSCCNDNSSDDIAAEDDEGHGTHVASIAAGDIPGYPGVAPDANIVAVKVCNERGLCAVYDIIAGIDWCVANREAYNITAINISIGSGDYATHCDASHPAYAAAIDAATTAGIAVVVASGNYGHIDGISAPACIESAIPVGGVDDYDIAYSGYNRGEILDLLAPGRTIQAARMGGGTTVKSGTSMATPHVAGSILLLNQYLHLRSLGKRTPAELEDALILSGYRVYDLPSDRWYSRIDPNAAMFVLDDCNSNGQLDGNELENGSGYDWNRNEVPDECDRDLPPNVVPQSMLVRHPRSHP